MNIHQALKMHLNIKKKWPDLVVCGSFVLIGKALIPRRELGDIDYICSRKYFQEIVDKDRLFKLSHEPYSKNDLESFERYDTFEAFFESDGEQRKVNVFVYNKVDFDKLRLVENETIGTHFCEKMIIKIKKNYDREKDSNDFKIEDIGF